MASAKSGRVPCRGAPPNLHRPQALGCGCANPASLDSYSRTPFWNALGVCLLISDRDYKRMWHSICNFRLTSKAASPSLRCPQPRPLVSHRRRSTTWNGILRAFSVARAPGLKSSASGKSAWRTHGKSRVCRAFDAGMGSTEYQYVYCTTFYRTAKHNG